VAAAPGARAPLTADATRGRHFRAIVGGRWFVLPVAIAAAGGFVYGASQGSVPVMAASPVAAVLLGLIVSYFVADHRAESEFFGSYAAQRRFAHHDQSSLLEYTPLLGAGDRRHCSHLMEGEYKGVRCRLSHYTYEIRRTSTDSKGHTSERWEKHPFTVCVVDMEAALGTFPGFFMRRNRGLLGKLGDDEWLSGRGFPRVQVESISFGERYELYRDRSMDEVMLRQLFSPTLVEWLAEHPLGPGVEFKTGTLVVFVEEHLEEAGKLDWLLDSTIELTGRIAREVAEAAHRP
jgi:hypothetical protein